MAKNNLNDIDDWEDVEIPTDTIDDWEDVDQPIQEDEVSQTESGLRGAAQGLTLDFADEIAGASEAAYETAFGEDKLSNIAKSYQKYRDESRKAFEKAEEANPGTYLAGMIAGSVAPAIASGGAGALAGLGKVAAKEGLKGVTKATGKEGFKALLSSPLGKSIGTGAGYGSVGALGMSKKDLIEGDVAGAAKDAAIGAGVGAAGSVLLPIAGKGLKKAGSALADFVPAVSVPFRAAKELGLLTEKKLSSELRKNTEDLLKSINKSFRKLGMDEKQAQEAAESLNKTYDVTGDIKEVIKSFRKKSEGTLTTETDKYNKIINELEVSLLKKDSQRQKLIKNVRDEIRRKTIQSENKIKKIKSEGEAKAVIEAEKSGDELVTLTEKDKTFEDVSEMVFDTQGGKVAGQTGKFKSKYVDPVSGKTLTEDRVKTYLKNATPFKSSPIEVFEEEVEDGVTELVAKYVNEATGEVFEKRLKKLQQSKYDFDKLSVDDLLQLVRQYGKLGYNEGNEVYQDLYKVIRNKLNDIDSLPESKRKMADLYDVMGILGIDDKALNNMGNRDVIELSKSLRGKLDLEKSGIQERILDKGSEVSKRLDDFDLTSKARDYIKGSSSQTSGFSPSTFFQKLASNVSGVAGAAAKPISKVANKPFEISDNALQAVSNKLSQSSSKGAKALSEQIKKASVDGGPTKNALNFSLLQQPAFRQAMQSTDEAVYEGLESIDDAVGEATGMTDQINNFKNTLNSLEKMLISGNQTPEIEIEKALGAIEELDISEDVKDDLKGDVIQAQTPSDIEALKQSIERYQNR